MGIKILLMDLDGTLLTTNKQLTAYTRGVLERAVAAGIHVVPSTGRYYDGIPPVVRTLPFVRYAMCVNGAQVYDVQEKQVIRRAELPLELSLRIFRHLDTLPVIYDCFLDGSAYMYRSHYERIDEYISDYHVSSMVKELRQPVDDLYQFVSDTGKSLQKIQMFFRDMDVRAGQFGPLQAAFPETIVSTSIYNNIEFNIPEANKGEALRFLCRHLGVDVADTMAFGDSANDLTMIQAAGIGVAMANASPEVRAAADYVTDTNDEDGVARAIERFCFS